VSATTGIAVGEEILGDGIGRFDRTKPVMMASQVFVTNRDAKYPRDIRSVPSQGEAISLSCEKVCVIPPAATM
jgi:hypothetical protein